jgi:ElaB/YqjD/DUF883 family membrane-anchored ribosome-binding protein
MTIGSDARGKLEDAQDQIARLREQVESLLKDQVTPAVAAFAGRAENAAQSATASMRDQAKVVSGQVKERPLVAILIAAALGWVIGRVMH